MRRDSRTLWGYRLENTLFFIGLPGGLPGGMANSFNQTTPPFWSIWQTALIKLPTLGMKKIGRTPFGRAGGALYSGQQDTHPRRLVIVIPHCTPPKTGSHVGWSSSIKHQLIGCREMVVNPVGAGCYVAVNNIQQLKITLKPYNTHSPKTFILTGGLVKSC
jgi:hypothetical protein